MKLFQIKKNESKKESGINNTTHKYLIDKVLEILERSGKWKYPENFIAECTEWFYPPYEDAYSVKHTMVLDKFHKLINFLEMWKNKLDINNSQHIKKLSQHIDLTLVEQEQFFSRNVVSNLSMQTIDELKKLQTYLEIINEARPEIKNCQAIDPSSNLEQKLDDEEYENSSHSPRCCSLQ